MDQKKAKLTLPDGKTIELPFIEGKMGKPAIDISQLSQHGLHTYDPGHVWTTP
jgi:citrate synthase